MGIYWPLYLSVLLRQLPDLDRCHPLCMAAARASWPFFLESDCIPTWNFPAPSISSVRVSCSSVCLHPGARLTCSHAHAGVQLRGAVPVLAGGPRATVFNILAVTATEDSTPCLRYPGLTPSPEVDQVFCRALPSSASQCRHSMYGIVTSWCCSTVTLSVLLKSPSMTKMRWQRIMLELIIIHAGTNCYQRL